MGYLELGMQSFGIEGRPLLLHSGYAKPAQGYYPTSVQAFVWIPERLYMLQSNLSGRRVEGQVLELLFSLASRRQCGAMSGQVLKSGTTSYLLPEGHAILFPSRFVLQKP